MDAWKSLMGYYALICGTLGVVVAPRVRHPAARFAPLVRAVAGG